MKIGMSDLGSSYYINFPTSGHMDVEHRGASYEVDPTRAAVYQPLGDIRMRTSDDYRSYAVEIETRAPEDTLEQLLGRPVRRPLNLAPHLDIGTGPGESWARMVRLMAADAARRPGC
jgi:hypothetical protein